MSALGEWGFPVPQVVAVEPLSIIADRALVILELVEGESWEVAVAERGDAEVAHAAVGVVRRLSGVPLAETGIGDEPRLIPSTNLIVGPSC